MSHTNHDHLTSVPSLTLALQTASPGSCPSSCPRGFSHSCSSALLYGSLRLVVPEDSAVGDWLEVISTVTLVRSTGTATLHFKFEILVLPFGRLDDAL